MHFTKQINCSSTAYTTKPKNWNHCNINFCKMSGCFSVCIEEEGSVWQFCADCIQLCKLHCVYIYIYIIYIYMSHWLRLLAETHLAGDLKHIRPSKFNSFTDRWQYTLWLACKPSQWLQELNRKSLMLPNRFSEGNTLSLFVCVKTAFKVYSLPASCKQHTTYWI